MTHSLRRYARAALAAVFTLASLLAASLPARAQGTLPYDGQLVYSVFRGNNQIGEHRYTFERIGNQLHVRVHVTLEVKLGFITVFRYVHDNHETWDGDRLVAIQTKTNDDGKPFEVTGRRTAEGFEVQGMNGRIVMPADIMPSSYWHPDSPKRTEFLDTQRGIPLALNFAPAGREMVMVTDGLRVPAQRYEVTGDLKVTAWYAENGAWAKLAFPARGSVIDYAMAVGTPVVP